MCVETFPLFIRTESGPEFLEISSFSVCAMGKKSALHEAAERGDSDSLQRLLTDGSYDVNEGSDGSDGNWKAGVLCKREREKEREMEKGRK